MRRTKQPSLIISDLIYLDNVCTATGWCWATRVTTHPTGLSFRIVHLVGTSLNPDSQPRSRHVRVRWLLGVQRPTRTSSWLLLEESSLETQMAGRRGPDQGYSPSWCPGSGGWVCPTPAACAPSWGSSPRRGWCSGSGRPSAAGPGPPSLCTRSWTRDGRAGLIARVHIGGLTSTHS